MKSNPRVARASIRTRAAAVVAAHSLISMAAVGSVIASLFVGGCATPPRADHYTRSPSGTTNTYQQRNTGSFGTDNTPLVVTVGETTWQGKRAVTYSRAKSTTDVQDWGTHKMLAVLAADGRPVMTYDPPLGYELPFEVGKTWVAKSNVTTMATGKVAPVEARFTIEACEDLSVPAGTFKVWRIRIVNVNGEEQVARTSTEYGMAVKRSFVRPPTHPEGAGTREVELIARALPR